MERQTVAFRFFMAIPLDRDGHRSASDSGYGISSARVSQLLIPGEKREEREEKKKTMIMVVTIMTEASLSPS
jgi:hypothetical protein